jgi:DNA-binding MarR family transcriptional regulator
VQREADPEDRRAVFVSLTEKGHKVLEEATAARRDLNHMAFARMAPETRRQLLDGLQALVSTLDGMAPERKKA